VKSHVSDRSETSAWDWTTIVVIGLGIVLLLIITFELRIPHPFAHQ